MDDEFTELNTHDLEYHSHEISKKDIIDIFLAYDISFIRYFGSNLFYVEMVDGEPLVPAHPMGAYPPGIERLFDLMAKERLNMLSCENGKLMISRFPVNNDEL